MVVWVRWAGLAPPAGQAGADELPGDTGGFSGLIQLPATVGKRGMLTGQSWAHFGVILGEFGVFLAPITLDVLCLGS